jgi:hypothetical protein
MTSQCLQCAKPLRGRSDKKFCCDVCRVSFHNNLNSQKSGYIRNVNSILARNRKILEECLFSQLTEISKSKLQQRGFNFQFYTNKERSPNGEGSYYCYDYGYRPTRNNTCVLVNINQSDL